jgi:hypothetical protein
VDPVTLVVTALAAGAASAAVKEAYQRLRDAVRARLAGRPGGELVLARHEAAPQTWQAPLTAELAGAGTGSDESLAVAARALMELLDAAGSRAGKYQVTVSGSRGVQVGDHNAQTNTFGSGPA